MGMRFLSENFFKARWIFLDAGKTIEFTTHDNRYRNLHFMLLT